MPPKVLNRHTATQAALDKAVYVGRPSKWGNPFKIGGGYGHIRSMTREQAIDQYEDWLLHSDRGRDLLACIGELRGRDLACWCAPKRCHADLLLRLANSIDNTVTVCEDAPMPRKKRTTTADTATAVLDPDDGRLPGQILPLPPEYDGTIEDWYAKCLEIVPAPEMGDSVVSRLHLADLVASAEQHGVDVPATVRNYAPSLQDILEEYRRLSEIASQAEKDAKTLRTRILARMDQDQCDELPMDIGGELYRIPMPGKESLNKVRYVELGGDLDLLDRALEAGEPYYQVRYRKPKEAKGQ